MGSSPMGYPPTTSTQVVHHTCAYMIMWLRNGHSSKAYMNDE